MQIKITEQKELINFMNITKGTFYHTITNVPMIKS